MTALHLGAMLGQFSRLQLLLISLWVLWASLQDQWLMLSCGRSLASACLQLCSLPSHDSIEQLQAHSPSLAVYAANKHRPLTLSMPWAADVCQQA